MKKTKKSISFVFLILGLTLILADCGYFVFSNSYTITTYDSCSDITANWGQTHSHSHSHEDNVVLLDSISKRICFQFDNDNIFLTERNSIIFFSSKIWQPPKLS